MNGFAKIIVFFCLAAPAFGQTKRLWILRPPGEMEEYDSTTFAEKQKVKAPPQAMKSPRNLLVNHLGQMLFVAAVSLPLSDDELVSGQTVWLWDGHAAHEVPRGVTRATAAAGSNVAISEVAPMPALTSDGLHLLWFANEARRLQRDGVDLSTKTIWHAWRTDLAGGEKEEIASTSFPDCRCTTGGCEETCPYGETWFPDDGVGTFFVVTQFVAGEMRAVYKSSSLYAENAGKWTATDVTPPLQRILDAGSSNAILEAIPDTACCGSQNQSNDQTRLRLSGKTLAVFDEQAQFSNPDYDVSFYTGNGKLSPDLAHVALTIVASSPPNTAIQLSEEGQANPEEGQRIRKALAEMPAVEVKSVEDSPRRVLYLPRCQLVGWLDNKEILVVEDHLLTIRNITTGSRRKSTIKVDDASFVFLR